jgi:multidrug efflux pump subunit AcrA (membrane-fusion protein)
MRRVKYPSIILTVLFLGFGGIAYAEEDKCEGEHDEHNEHNEVSVSKGSQELIEVKTTVAKLEPFDRKVSVVGQIAQDAEHTINVGAPGSGKVVECMAHIGAMVKKGDVLCKVKLVSDDGIVEVKAPIAGVVIGGSAKEGEKVDTVSSMHTIADFSVLQATFDVYEKDLRHVKLGQEICVRSVAYPDQCFDGHITFISPRVDPQTNAIKIRADIGNPENILKLGMFVLAEISVKSPEKYIVVPVEAVHSSGDEKMIFVKTAPEKFEAHKVTVAEQSAGKAAISSGICEGEEMVTENSFLLKSELLKSKMGDGCAD